MLTQFTLPTGAVQSRSLAVVKQIEHHLLVDEKKDVAGVFAISGFSLGGAGQNLGLAFAQLRDWKDRKGATNRAPAIAARAITAFSHIRDAQVFAFIPPAVQELGNANGFDLELEDVGGLGHEALGAARDQLLGMAAQNPKLVGVRPNGQEDTPQLKIKVDLARAGALGIAATDISSTISTAWGGTYINQFTDRGRVKHVYMEGDAPFRMAPTDLDRWYVRNSTGTMAPFSAFSRSNWIFSAARLESFNDHPSMEIQGQSAPGVSSGAAMDEMEALIKKLPKGIGHEWTGLSYQERLAGSPGSTAVSILKSTLLAQTAVQQTRADVAADVTFVAQDKDALDLVVGAAVPEKLLPNGLDNTVSLLTNLPSGLPSDVLLSRPDVVAAEHTLKSANAQIGAARAAFFPTISLTGSGGAMSMGLSSLFKGAAGQWSFEPQISIPLFDGGTNRANLNYQKAEKQVDIAQYEKAIQTAFREVADALVRRATIGEQLSADDALVAAARGSLRLSTARYERGSDTYLNVLIAQRTLYSAEQAQIAVRLIRSTNLVSLYAALGGGAA